jgi:predicted GH43/DUF377 family glycosyl hydrolase
MLKTAAVSAFVIGSSLQQMCSAGGGRHGRVPPSAECALGPPYPTCNSDEYPRQNDFSATVVARNPFGRPLVTNMTNGSFYPYNFNTAWFPAPNGSVAADGLIVRVQEDWDRPNATHPEWTDTGALTAVRADLAAGTAEYIDQGLVFWAGTPAPPRVNAHEWGAIDPRIRYRPSTGEYYLTWDNCTYECGFRSSLLSVSRDPFDHDSWALVGPVIPGMQTAGVALLFRDDATEDETTAATATAATGGMLHVVPAAAQNHLAFVSSYNCFTILLAESADGRSWAISNDTWMQGRPGCWDACGAIAGPQPEVLSTGDYLLIYNIDTRIHHNTTSPLGRCTIGWAILDGTDPRRIVARANEALVVPELPWEATACAGSASTATCQTPYVIFADGLKPLGNDEFLVIYGGGDSDTGAIKISVRVPGSPASSSSYEASVAP